MFTIHIRKDVTLQEDKDLRRHIHRSFQIDFQLPPSLKLERVVPDPEYLWDSFNSTFLSNDSSKSSAAKLNITIRKINGNFGEAFSLILIVGWMRLTEKPFAVLYGATESADTARWRIIGHVLPADFPDVVGDNVNWGHARQDIFENALSTISSTPRFQAMKAQFITKWMVHRGSFPELAEFHVTLESRCDDADVITYRVCLSGSYNSRLDPFAASIAYKEE
ncbi:hypothetical protein LZ31DRAFT_595391 [Colletotrichum somersetense]|nr:hypothetical protein LZ31DRAFT_595391 [Colletotrichum somersetense]